MGVACCASDDSSQLRTPTHANCDNYKDLSAPMLLGKSQYERFELSFPMARIDIAAFSSKLQRAHEKCNKEGWVTIEALAEFFHTEAWLALKNHESNFCRFLLSPSFKEEGYGE